MVRAGVTVVVEADEAPERPATRTAATAPPPASAATAIHRPRCPPVDIVTARAGAPGGRGATALAAPEMYWKETMPARTCSFDARMRIWNRPAARLNCIPRALAWPFASVVTTEVRSELPNVPLGPSSGMWKLTTAPSMGRPVSSVTSTVSGRALREPGAWTAPSPSITCI